MECDFIEIVDTNRQPQQSLALSSTANPQQQQAILTTDGPVLIIAGPGSGKTYTLVERIVYLITQKNVTPESLFVVTFTDKAARELTTRISNRLNALVSSSTSTRCTWGRSTQFVCASWKSSASLPASSATTP